MNIVIRNTGEAPIYEQITQQVKAAILSGELAEGAPLPSIRLLAKELRISVVTMSGKGSFVAPQNIELMREEQRRHMEQLLSETVDAARIAGVSREELAGLLALYYDEEPDSLP